MDKHVEQRADITSRFGRRLQGLRKARGITQTKLARHLGIDRSFLSDLENGKASPTLVTMELIALGFQMSLPDLFRPIEPRAAQVVPGRHPLTLVGAEATDASRPDVEQLSAIGARLSETGVRYLRMHRH